jgi:DNA sulfur modification protein DndC
LESILKNPEWQYLSPLLRLRPLYAELKKPHNRLRKDGSETKKDGTLVANPMRMGPLTMEARMMGLTQVLNIQSHVNTLAELYGRPKIDLINFEEHARILDLIEANTWPDRWTGTEVRADVILNEVMKDGSVQNDFFAVAL